MTQPKTLADLIVGHGRWWPGQSAQEVLHQIVNTDQLNALRDELVELRAAADELEGLKAGRRGPLPEGITHHADGGRGLTTCCRTPAVELAPIDRVTDEPADANCGGRP